MPNNFENALRPKTNRMRVLSFNKMGSKQSLLHLISKWISMCVIIGLAFGEGEAQACSAGNKDPEICFFHDAYVDNNPEIEKPHTDTMVWHLCGSTYFEFCYDGACNKSEYGTCFCVVDAKILDEEEGGTGSHGLRLTLLGQPYTCWRCFRIEAKGTLDEVTEGNVVIQMWSMDGRTDIRKVYVSKEAACSGGSCSKNVFGMVNAANQSVLGRFGLGQRAFGKSAGGLYLKEINPTNRLSSPLALVYQPAWGYNYEIIYNALGVRQIVVPDGVVNVVSNTPQQYRVEFYPTSALGSRYTNSECTGCYNLSGNPLKSHWINNPDPTGNSSNVLHLIEDSGHTNIFEWKTNGWELSQNGGNRKEYRHSYYTNNSTVHHIFKEIRNQTNILSWKEHEVYTNFNGSFERRVQQVQGEGVEAVTNFFSYCTSGDSTYGLLASKQGHQGDWELFAYDQQMLTNAVYSSFLNQGPTTNGLLCLSTEFSYDPGLVTGSDNDRRAAPRKPYRIIQRLQGQEIARTYYVYQHGLRKEIKCAVAGAMWSNANNQVTISRWYTTGVFPENQQLQSVEYPDGTMTIYQYYHGNYWTNIVLTGAPNAAKNGIINGTQEITVLNDAGNLVSKTTLAIESGLTVITAHESHSDFDSYNRPQKVTYLDGTWAWTDYGCCGSVNETNREGTAITHFEDGLKRRTATRKNNITHTNVYDAEGNLLAAIRIGSDDTRITNVVNTYDTSGRLTRSTDALGNITTYAESITNFQRTVVTTYPDESTRVEIFYRDGRLAKLTGTAVHPVRYEYGVEQDGSDWRQYTKEVKLDRAGNDTLEWKKTYKDMLGREYKTVYADGNTEQQFYNTKSQLIKSMDPDGVTTLYQYNIQGEREYTAIDLDRDGVIDFNGSDRITRTASGAGTATALVGRNVRLSQTYSWDTFNSSVSNLLSATETSTDELVSWTSIYGLTNRTDKFYAGNGHVYETNAAPDATLTLNYYQHGRLMNTTRNTAGGTTLAQTTYGYDAHGRQRTITDLRNGTTTQSFDDADRLTSVTTPLPGTGQNAQTTTYAYDYAGRTTRIGLPDGTSQTNIYAPSGELLTNLGARTYPVAYAYDSQGRRTNMITWTNFASRTGAATTSWKYDSYRGFLTNKVYADGQAVVYIYTPAGRLLTRRWARGITTTFQTNAAGEVVEIIYSAGSGASNATYYLDRLGRRTNIVDGAGSHLLSYNLAGQLLLETNTTGPLAGLALAHRYDRLNRCTNTIVYRPGAAALNQYFGYDSASRLTNVSDGVYGASYGYLANSPLIGQLTLRSNNTTRMITTKAYDYLSRLSGIRSVNAQQVVVAAFDYAYNDANQRVQRTESDGSYWPFDYDRLGQVTSVKRHWADGTLVAGQQFEYGFDDIGNRRQSKTGGDQHGGGLRLAGYTVNALNQTAGREVPGYQEALGVANPQATLSINGDASVYRRGEYFRKEVAVNNTTGALWQAISVQGVLSNLTNTATGNVFVPRSPETLGYDLDGNQTNDGHWVYTWDGENRLVGMESAAGLPSGAWQKLVFGYDQQGRRISKTVSNWNGSAWVLASQRKYLYDGWNLMAILDGSLGLQQSFLWGLDLSGSTQGAGGVGGLLAVKEANGLGHFAGYDGDGNLVMLMEAVGGETSARYEYGPFGESLRASGAMAKANPFRFSTKFQDQETDLLYFGYRYYSPATGRWLSRDPIEEEGGVALYVYAANDPINFVDPLGLKFCMTARYDFELGRYFRYLLPQQVVEQMGNLTVRAQVTDCYACCNGRMPSGWDKQVAVGVRGELQTPKWRPFAAVPFIYLQGTIEANFMINLTYKRCQDLWSGGGCGAIYLGGRAGIDKIIPKSWAVYGDVSGGCQLCVRADRTSPKVRITLACAGRGRIVVTYKLGRNGRHGYSGVWEWQTSSDEEEIFSF